MIKILEQTTTLSDVTTTRGDCGGKGRGNRGGTGAVVIVED